MGASIIADWQQELQIIWSSNEYRKKLGVYVR